jgi:hypothetical protein
MSLYCIKEAAARLKAGRPDVVCGAPMQNGRPNRAKRQSLRLNIGGPQPKNIKRATKEI